MLPILSQFLCDNESLFEYERCLDGKHIVDFRHICRRLIAVERQANPFKSDIYYESLGDMYLTNYENFDDFIWRMPCELAEEYLFRSRDSLYVKAERFDGWMNLITQVPPSLIIAANFLDDFSMCLLQPNDIFSFAKRKLSIFKYTAQLLPFLPDLNYLVQEAGGLNDLHIHLNGTTETDVLWNYMLQNPCLVAKDYLEVYNSRLAVRKLSEQIIADFTPMTLLKRLEDAREIRRKMVVIIASGNDIFKQGTVDRLKDSLILRNLWGEVRDDSSLGILVEELLLYLLVMYEIKRTRNMELVGWFHHYLLIKGLVHRFIVMQQTQTGFSQFQLLTENSFRYRVEKLYKNRFLQLSGCGGQVYLGTLEGRFSPKESLIENSRLVASIMKGYEKAKEESGLLGKSNLLLVAHFIKEPESKKVKKLAIRHRLLRKKLQKKALALDSFLHRSKYSSKIVGIDAAANELDAGPEVFSQIFRFLRKRGIEHVTFHVGEDFRHLLSGLRSIWEAIDFLELRSGDRLGHCTAVGISPELWRTRIGNICFVSQGEWLDDLVFVWELIKESHHIKLQKVVLELESKIHELAYKIYGDFYPPYLLCLAWKLRKYDPFLYLEKKYSKIAEWDSVESYKEYKKVIDMLKNEKVRNLMNMYHAPLLGRGSRAEYDKLIQIETTGVISVDMLELLQCIMLEKMAKKGVAIEALPSSNLRISYYRELGEYHLKKWLEVQETDCLLPPVVLGTDDPGIFMTNIYNEYARAYLHLESCGFSPIKRMNVITDLQRSCNIYKFMENEQ